MREKIRKWETDQGIERKEKEVGDRSRKREKR